MTYKERLEELYDMAKDRQSVSLALEIADRIGKVDDLTCIAKGAGELRIVPASAE